MSARDDDSQEIYLPIEVELLALYRWKRLRGWEPTAQQRSEAARVLHRLDDYMIEHHPDVESYSLHGEVVWHRPVREPMAAWTVTAAAATATTGWLLTQLVQHPSVGQVLACIAGMILAAAMWSVDVRHRRQYRRSVLLRAWI